MSRAEQRDHVCVRGMALTALAELSLLGVPRLCYTAMPAVLWRAWPLHARAGSGHMHLDHGQVQCRGELLQTSWFRCLSYACTPSELMALASAGSPEAQQAVREIQPIGSGQGHRQGEASWALKGTLGGASTRPRSGGKPPLPPVGEDSPTGQAASADSPGLLERPLLKELGSRLSPPRAPSGGRATVAVAEAEGCSVAVSMAKADEVGGCCSDVLLGSWPPD